jgi:hypothetical protein
LTVRLMVVVSLSVPDLPEMLIADVPVEAAPLTARVKLLVPVVLVGLKVAMTPDGRPDAERVTVP